MASPTCPTSLDRLPPHQPMQVIAVTAPPGAPEWPGQLQEIGFLPGEEVCVLTRGAPGRDPLVVRVGDSTFALRRAEAACVLEGAVQESNPSRTRHA